jgi:hypothetical protein
MNSGKPKKPNAIGGFNRPYGTVLSGRSYPRDKSLGYFQSPLRGDSGPEIFLPRNADFERYQGAKKYSFFFV